jgi:hypothetical protein
MMRLILSFDKSEKFSPCEGGIYAVPLENGRWGIVFLAAKGSRGPFLLLYLFDVSYAECPELKEALPFVVKENAISIRRAGNPGIRMGRWRLVGILPGFRREHWLVTHLAEGMGGATVIDEKSLADSRYEPAGPPEHPKATAGIATYSFIEAWLTRFATRRI